MLGMVTKDFYSEAYIALWMFEVIGHEYDEMAAWALRLRDEAFPQTCTWSIAIWEWVYGFPVDEELSLPYRRNRILAHIIGEAPLNPEVIRRGVAALTEAEVEIIENVAPYTFKVVVTPSGASVNYSEIWRYLRRIKPAHLSFLLITIMQDDIFIGWAKNPPKATTFYPETVTGEVLEYRSTVSMGAAGSYYSRGEAATVVPRDGAQAVVKVGAAGSQYSRVETETN